MEFIDLGQDTPGLEGLVAQADTLLLGSAIPPSGSQLLLDLAPLMGSEAFHTDGFWPGALEGCQAGEAQKGLPVHLGPNLVLFNKAAFDQAGVAYPKPGWAWEDFEAAAQAVSNPTATPPRYGLVTAQARALLSSVIDAALAGGGDSAQLASDLQWYVDLARQGRAAGAIQALPDGGAELIRKGQVAMWLGTLSSLSNEWTSLDFEVGAAPFPMGAHPQATTPMGVTCAAISAGTSQPAASWEWLAFLSQNPPPDISFAAPAWTPAAESQGYWQLISPETGDSVRFALEHAWYGWVKSDFTLVGEALEKAVKTRADLASLLPEDLSTLTRQAELPEAGYTPAAVAPSPSAPTETPVARPANALGAVYFVDPDYHTSQKDVRALAEAFNQSHLDLYVEIATERTGFDSGFYSTFDVNQFDCFASTGGAILPIHGDTEDVDFAGNVYTLDPLLDAAGASLLDELDPTVLEAARLDGALYGLPVAIQPYVVYYNATLLEELGLEPPAPDWTVEDFWALAAEAAARKEGVYGYIPSRMYSPYYFLSTAQYLDPTQTWPEASYDDATLIGLLDQLALLAEGRALYPVDNGGTRSFFGNFKDRDEQLVRGNAVLWVNQAGMRLGLDSENIDWGPNPPSFKFEVGVATFPMDQTVNPAASTSVYISRRAENPQVCWEWFKFLADQPTNVFQGIPLRRSILDSEAWAASAGSEKAEVYRTTLSRVQISTQLDYGPPTPLRQWWEDALAAVLLDSQDASTVLRAIQFKAQATLDCMKAAGVSPNSMYTEEQYETEVSCAYASDPDYKSQEDLTKEEFGAP